MEKDAIPKDEYAFLQGRFTGDLFKEASAQAVPMERNRLTAVATTVTARSMSCSVLNRPIPKRKLLRV